MAETQAWRLPKGYARKISVKTTSGDVAAVLAAVPARLDASSTSGGIALSLPQDAQFILDARSSGGGRHALAGRRKCTDAR